MGYSYVTTGGSRKAICLHSNVWFYPRIRVVPQSEYSYWGITDTDCLVFDTYFLSNSSWNNTGIMADQQVIESATQLPKKVIFKDETAGTSQEAQAIGYSWIDQDTMSQVYQAVWIRPQVVKCTISKGYITAISCSMLRWNDQNLYYMGKSPVNPVYTTNISDHFVGELETSETLKWRISSTGDESTGRIGDEYFYFKDFKTTSSPPSVTYYLFKSVEKIYKYRTFYFIMPTGSTVEFATQGLDFFAYNGWDNNYGIIKNLYTYKDLINDEGQVCWYFNGWRSNVYNGSDLIKQGRLICDGLTELNSSSLTNYKNIYGSKLYDSSQSNNRYKWSAAVSNQILLYGFNSSTGTFSYSKRGYGDVEVMEDNELAKYSSSVNPLSISGMTIDFGEPHCQYMYLPYDCDYDQYYAYVNTACKSLYGCTPVYLSGSRSMGMKNTTITESTTFSSAWTYNGTVTVKNEHDSNGYYRVIINYYNYDGSWTRLRNPAESWIEDMGSKTYSYSGSSITSPYYTVQVACTNISETEFGEIIIYQKQYTCPVKLIGVDTSMNTNFLSNVTLYYNSDSSYSRISNSNSIIPTTYNYPEWYRSPVIKIASNTRSWTHSCRQYSRCICYYRTYNGSWNSYTGPWKYYPSYFSNQSSTASWYDTDITLTCNWTTNALRKQVYFTTDFKSILPPTIQTCTDAGDWSRSIKVYNPNLISLTLGYSSNKTTSKSSANSGWNTKTLASQSYTTLTIGDQGGFSDEWILCGFQVGSSLFYCNTIDEDPVSGTPSVVNSSFYYSR